MTTSITTGAAGTNSQVVSQASTPEVGAVQATGSEREAILQALRFSGTIDVSREGSTVVGVGIGPKAIAQSGPLYAVQGYSGPFITIRTPTSTDDYRVRSANRAITEAVRTLTGKDVPVTVYGTVSAGTFHVTRIDPVKLSGVTVGGIGPKALAPRGPLYKVPGSQGSFITVSTGTSTDDYAVRSKDARITKLVQNLTGKNVPVQLFGSIDGGTFNVTRLEIGTIRER